MRRFIKFSITYLFLLKIVNGTARMFDFSKPHLYVANYQMFVGSDPKLVPL